MGGRTVAGAFALCLAASNARAAPHASEPKVRLYYEKAGGIACPDVEALEAGVAERLGYAPFAEDAPEIILVAVSLDDGVALRARLSLIDLAGHESAMRDLVSLRLDCAELAETLELAIAVAISGAEERAETEANRLAAAREGWARTRLPGEPSEPPPAVGTPAAWRARLGMGARASVGQVPRLAPGFVLELTGRRGALGMGVELSADFSPPVEVDEGRVETSLYRAALVGCRHGGLLALCALAAAGALEAEGSGFPRDETAVGLYLAIGGRIAVEVPLPGGFSALIYAGGESALHGSTLVVMGGTGWSWTAPGAALAGGLTLRSAIP